MDQWFSIRALSRETSVPRGLIDRAIRSGDLEAVRKGNRLYIKSSDFLAFMERDEDEQPPRARVRESSRKGA